MESKKDIRKKIFAERKLHTDEQIEAMSRTITDKVTAVPAFKNVNDGTNEGLAYVGKNIFTVQFHPEACPGPQDSGYLFDRFLEMMGGEK